VSARSVIALGEVESMWLAAGDPRQQEDGGREGDERAEDPRRHGEPGASQRASRPAVAPLADRVHARAPVGQNRAVSADRAVAAGAGAGRGCAAVDASRVTIPVVVVEQKLRRHRASLAPLEIFGAGWGLSPPPNPWVALGASRV